MLKSLAATLFHKKSAPVAFAVFALTLMFAGQAMAFTAPQTGDMFYEIYDLVINKVLGGPIGFAIGAIMVVGGIILLVQGKGLLLPLICLIGGVILVKVESLVTSFGFSFEAVKFSATHAMQTASQFLM